MICDYSHWNGVIDWSKAVSAGVIGAYLKASQGTTLIDSQFKRSAAACPLKYKGAYHFFDYWTGHYSVGDENGFGIRQANYFLNVIGDWKYTLPGALDIENNSGSGWEDLNKNIPRALKIVKGFVDRYKAVTGHYPVIYTSSYFTRYLTDFTDCPLWVAHYGVDKPVYYNWNEHALWQYSSEGDGVKYGNEAGNKYVDLNSIGIPLDKWAIGAQQDMKLEGIKLFSQRDPLWKADKLGTSTSTLGSFGCLVTCAASMLRYFGNDTDPGRLNKLLTDKGLYYNGNLFVFDSLDALFSVKIDWNNFIDCADKPAPLDKVDALLNQKRPVIVKVDFDVDDEDVDQHWVMIVGKEGGSYIILDPWDGVAKKFEQDYGDPARHIYRIAAWTGIPNPLDLIVTPEPLPEGKAVTLVNLNIRKGAGTSFTVWATAPKGTLLDALEVKGDWVRVGWQQWCMSQYNGVRYLA